jgi:hypothetical protein
MSASESPSIGPDYLWIEFSEKMPKIVFTQDRTGVIVFGDESEPDIIMGTERQPSIQFTIKEPTIRFRSLYVQ